MWSTRSLYRIRSMSSLTADACLLRQRRGQCVLFTNILGARVICGMRIAESCQGVICGKSSAKCSANYPLSLFRIPQVKKFHISADRRKTTVCSHCTTDVQPMHRSARRPAVPSFCILCGPFATEQCSFFLQFLNFKVSSTFQAGQCDWLQTV